MYAYINNHLERQMAVQPPLSWRDQLGDSVTIAYPEWMATRYQTIRTENDIDRRSADRGHRTWQSSGRRPRAGDPSGRSRPRRTGRVGPEGFQFRALQVQPSRIAGALARTGREKQSI